LGQLQGFLERLNIGTLMEKGVASEDFEVSIETRDSVLRVMVEVREVKNEHSKSNYRSQTSEDSISGYRSMTLGRRVLHKPLKFSENAVTSPVFRS
jgi:hypothetical protein